MAITTSYGVANIRSEFINRYSMGPGNIGANEGVPSVIALADGGFALSYIWNSFANPADHDVLFERYTATGGFRPFVGGFLEITFLDNFQAGIALRDPDSAQLSDGRIITTWSKTGNGIHYAIVDAATGNKTNFDTLLAGSSSSDFNSDVAALRTGGGFVVAKEVNTGPNNQDANITFHNSSGVLQATATLGGTTRDEQAPSIDVLANGYVVVVYERELVDNTDTFGVTVEIYTPAGMQVLAPYHFDVAGSQNRYPQVKALSAGGFVVFYEDNGVGSLGMSIAYFTEAGVLRSIQTADLDSITNDFPKISELANGFICATWTENGVDITTALYDPVTMTRVSSGPVVIENQAGQQEAVSSAGLSNGTFVSAWTDYNSAVADGNTDTIGSHVSIQIDAWVRTSTSDAQSDVMIGDGLLDSMRGFAGNDVLYGNGGNDTLEGGDDVDSLFGGPGGDVLNGGTNFDYARYDYAAIGVGARLYDAIYNFGEAVGDSYIDIEGLIGSAFGDQLYGNGLINVILGNDGNDFLDGVGGVSDYLYGGSGFDTFFGRPGADIIDGGADNDTVRYSYADAGLRAYLYDASQNTGYAAGDTYTSVESLFGSGFSDDLRGDSGDNAIFGEGGDDWIIGLGASDFLQGGSGQDLFHFVGIGDGGASGDTIDDFVSGNDRISVTGAFFGLGSPGGVAIDSFRFVAGSAANLATSQFIYNGATRQLFYDIDGTGAGVQVLLATLQVGATMAAGDIIVI
jgi:Ca2+-binding RTX toxin-like protein